MSKDRPLHKLAGFNPLKAARSAQELAENGENIQRMRAEKAEAKLAEINTSSGLWLEAANNRIKLLEAELEELIEYVKILQKAIELERYC